MPLAWQSPLPDTLTSSFNDMQIDVLIQTSPGRECNLEYCLRALKQQTVQEFGVMIIDDGSEQGQNIAQTQCQNWKPFQYLWRDNDYCMSRSYNLGLQASQADWVVMLSGDVLLNPHAIGFYQQYVSQLPPMLIYGYFGNLRDEIRISQWFAERQVNLKDERFAFDATGKLQFQQEMMSVPQHFAWGGNWAAPRQDLHELGFNEAFTGWGLEDVDLANRWIAQGGQISFAIDVWGEHQIHESPWNEKYYSQNKSYVGVYATPSQEPGLLYNPQFNLLSQILGISIVNLDLG